MSKIFKHSPKIWPKRFHYFGFLWKIFITKLNAYFSIPVLLEFFPFPFLTYFLPCTFPSLMRINATKQNYWPRFFLHTWKNMKKWFAEKVKNLSLRFWDVREKEYYAILIMRKCCEAIVKKLTRSLGIVSA